MSRLESYQVIYTLVEAGIVLVLKEKTWSRIKSGTEPMSSDALKKRPEIDILTLDDMQAPFIMFILMITICLSVAIVECFIANKKQQTSK